MVSTTADREQQNAFASAVAELLRQARRSQRLTQTDVAERTGGAISKAALANYETGHRSLRIDVFWAIAKALGEDPGMILSAAERVSGYGADAAEGPVTVDVDAIRESSEPRLRPVRRWFEMRLQNGTAKLAVRSITLDHGALAALAELMGVSAAECRRILVAATAAHNQGTPSSPRLAHPHAAAG